MDDMTANQTLSSEGRSTLAKAMMAYVKFYNETWVVAFITLMLFSHVLLLMVALAIQSRNPGRTRLQNDRDGKC